MEKDICDTCMEGRFLLPIVCEDAEQWADFYYQECLAA